MTRQKKSRKPNAYAPKADNKQKTKPQKEARRPKKTKGHTAGNRNNPEAVKVQLPGNSADKAKKDPRHGSKKAIDLTPVVETPQEIVELQPFEPKVKLEKAKEPTLTPEQELELIESDERLLALLERKENDELITGKDAKYFNAKMARHQELVEILGLDEDDDEDDIEVEFDEQDERSLLERWEDDDWDHDDK